MLYQFLLNFVDTFGFLNVFKYLTFRTGLSVFTSLRHNNKAPAYTEANQNF